jgi:hypothetical protein
MWSKGASWEVWGLLKVTGKKGCRATSGGGRGQSHASKFSNTFCCKCHKGEVYFQKQNITFNFRQGVKLGSKTSKVK